MERRPEKIAKPLDLSGLRHAEGFKLLKYVSKGGDYVETLWNSRDGVVPFMVSIEGVELMHAHWGSDIDARWHVPNIGDRVFIDMTEERARALVSEYLDRRWDLPAPEGGTSEREVFGDDRGKAFDSLFEQTFVPGAPDLVEVDQELQRKFYAVILEQEQLRMAEARLRMGRGSKNQDENNS